jgi:hypothetical protein
MNLETAADGAQSVISLTAADFRKRVKQKTQ